MTNYAIREMYKTTTTLMALDSEVVQLSCEGKYLLASTLTRCYLCDRTKEQFQQIGQQLRDGYFGAIFVKSDLGARIFCARPKSRLWEVNTDGTVQCTHQFSHLFAVSPTAFVSLYNEPCIIENACEEPPTKPVAQSFNFVKLFQSTGKHVITFRKTGVYVMNVDSASVTFWNNCFGPVDDLFCHDNSIFLWRKSNGGGEIRELVLLPAKKCLLALYLKNYHNLCAEVVYRLFDRVTEGDLSELKPLCNLHCWEENELAAAAADNRADILAKFKEAVSLHSEHNYKLESGIHIVNNEHLSAVALMGNSGGGIGVDQANIKVCDSLPSSTLNECDDGESTKECKNIVVVDEYGIDCNYFQEQPDFDDDYTLYNSPFLSVASCELLEAYALELGNNFSEKFSRSSQSIREKWHVLERKFQPRKRKNNVNEIIAANKMNDSTVKNKSQLDDDDEYEPIVVRKKKEKYKNVEIDFNLQELVDLCDGDGPLDVNEFMNVVFSKYEIITNKNPHWKKSFPFKMLDEKCFKKVQDLFQKFLSSNEISKWFQSEQCPLKEDEDFLKSYPTLLVQTYSRDFLKLDFLLYKTLFIFSELLNVVTILEDVKRTNVPCYYLCFCYVLMCSQQSENHYRYRSGGISSSNSEKWPLTVFLSTMLLVAGLDQVDVFCQMAITRRVESVDVIYLLLYLQKSGSNDDAGSTFTGKSTVNFCLTYLQTLYGSEEDDANIDGVFSNGPNDHYVVCMAIRMLIEWVDANVGEKSSSSSSSCVSCWFWLPDFGAKSSKERDVPFFRLSKTVLRHLWRIFVDAVANKAKKVYNREQLLKIKWAIDDESNEETPAEIDEYGDLCYKNVRNCAHLICKRVKLLLEHDEDGDNGMIDVELVLILNIVISFCHRIPELWTYLCRLQRTQSISSCGKGVRILEIDHFIQLGCVDEIEVVFEGFALTGEQARTLFALKSKLCDGYCLNCDARIPADARKSSWNHLAIYVLKKLGPTLCLNVLESFVENTQLDQSFYKSALLASIPGINNLSIDAVVKSACIHHDISPVSSNIFDELRVALKMDNRPGLKLTSENGKKSRSSSLKFKSDTDHHWGLAIALGDEESSRSERIVSRVMVEENYAICYSCSLPLLSKYLIKEDNGSGIMVFSCMHTYHTICLKNKACHTTCLVCDRFMR